VTGFSFEIRAVGHDFTGLIYVDIFLGPVLKKGFQFFINQFTLIDKY
jgi:hypothetical protein